MAGPRSLRQDFHSCDYWSHAQHCGFLQRETLSGLVPSNLANDINPVFDRNRFSSTFDYEKLKPTLRLASRFLETALPIFHSILCGTVRPVGEVGEAKTVCYSFPDPKSNLTDSQKVETWRKIEAFSEPMHFYLDNTGVETYQAVSWADSRTFGTLGMGLTGCSTNIWISRANLYGSLLDSLRNDEDLLQQQFWSFKLATTLVHELTHVAVFAATTDATDNFEYFLGDQGKSTELGFETEAWLFGGVTPNATIPTNCGTYENAETGQISEFNFMIVAHQYPDPIESERYRAIPAPYTIRKEGGGNKATLLWNTSFLHIHQLFQDKFWKQIIPSRGRRALFFERSTGLQFGFNAQGDVAALQRCAVEALYIPDGYYADQLGLIRRGADKSDSGQAKEVELSVVMEKIIASGGPKMDPPTSLARKAKIVWWSFSGKVKRRMLDFG